MKVLSVYPHHAFLFRAGVRSIETRSRPTKYRGELALAATTTIPGLRRDQSLTVGDYTVTRDDPRGCKRPMYLIRSPRLSWPYRLPTGAIVSIGTLTDAVPTGSLVWTSKWEHTVPGGFSGWVRYSAIPGGPPSQRILVDEAQRPYGDFTPGRFAWLLEDVAPVDPPVPFRGGPGLSRTWEPTP